MSNSPLIRTAVNLCLIAVIVIQPMALAKSQGTCAQVQCYGAQTVCQACKCCEVKTEGHLCSCCSSKNDDAPSCCSNKPERPEPDDLIEEILDVVSDALNSDDDKLVRDQAGSSSCLCGIRSEPMAPTPHRVPAPQLRELVVIAYLDDGVSDAGPSIRPDQLSSRLLIGDHSPHFSQRFLCIWRI